VRESVYMREGKGFPPLRPNQPGALISYRCVPSNHSHALKVWVCGRPGGVSQLPDLRGDECAQHQELPQERRERQRRTGDGDARVLQVRVRGWEAAAP
jgi:hypothetical protein